MTSQDVKELLCAMGAELFGVASLGPLRGYAGGNHPLDVCPYCFESQNGGKL